MKTMNNIEFAQVIVEELSKIMPDFSLEVKEVNKAGRGKLTGILFHMKDLEEDAIEATTTIYAEDLYVPYENGVSIEEITEEVVNLIKSAMGAMEQVTFLAENIRFDAEGENMGVRILDSKDPRNMEYVKETPYMEIDDTGLYLVAQFEADELCAVISTITFEDYGITKEELFAAALKGATSRKKPVLKELGAMRDEISRGVIDPESNILGRTDVEIVDGPYALTAEDGIMGSWVIALPEVRHEISRLLGDNCYAIPSSKHEWLIMPVNDKLSEEYVAGLIREANNTFVSEDDFLSDSLFAISGGEMKRLEV